MKLEKFEQFEEEKGCANPPTIKELASCDHSKCWYENCKKPKNHSPEPSILDVPSETTSKVGLSSEGAFNHSPQRMSKSEPPQEGKLLSISTSGGTFNLSLKRDFDGSKFIFHPKDIKTFIKKLKEGLQREDEDVNQDDYLFDEAHQRIIKHIDKLAGSDLI